MTDPRKMVLPKKPLPKEDVSAALGEAWFRVARQVGKGTLSDKTGAKCPKTVDNAISGRSVPEFHTVMNSLIACPTALEEVFRLYGGRFVPYMSEAANDYATIAGLNHAMGEWVHFLADFQRSPKETLRLADLLRPLVTALSAITEEADQIKLRGKVA